MELANWRWGWRGLVTTGMIFPIFSMVAMGLFARDLGPHALSYVLTGNVILALMFENLGKMTSRFSYLRLTGGLDFYATLPIRRSLLILAIAFSFLTLSLPAVLVTLVFGTWYLGIPVHYHPLLVPVIPMAVLPLSGLGALIGSAPRSPEENLALSRVLTLALLSLGPVLFPPERLPAALLWLGKLSPATYAASALRQTLLGPVGWQLPLDLTALTLFTLGAFWLVNRQMRWRRG